MRLIFRSTNSNQQSEQQQPQQSQEAEGSNRRNNLQIVTHSNEEPMIATNSRNQFDNERRASVRIRGQNLETRNINK